MKKYTQYAACVASITFILLIGIGVQYLVNGFITDNAINFYKFNIVEWVLEIIYIVFLVSFGLYLSIEED